MNQRDGKISHFSRVVVFPEHDHVNVCVGSCAPDISRFDCDLIGRHLGFGFQGYSIADFRLVELLGLKTIVGFLNEKYFKLDWDSRRLTYR